MNKKELKELIGIIIFGIINTFIAFSVTHLLGVSNTVILRTFSAIYGNITWEVLIFLGIGLIESSIYEIHNEYSYRKILYKM